MDLGESLSSTSIAGTSPTLDSFQFGTFQDAFTIPRVTPVLATKYILKLR